MNTHPLGWKIEMYVKGELGSPDSPAIEYIEKHLLCCRQCIDYAAQFYQSLEGIPVVPTVLANEPAESPSYVGWESLQLASPMCQ